VRTDRAPQRRAPAKRILLVDGEPDSRELLAEALADHGYAVDEATAARDALDVVDLAPPDVIVYSIAWSAGRHALRQLEDAVRERTGVAPSVVLETPPWMRLRPTRGRVLRRPVQLGDLLVAIHGALADREAERGRPPAAPLPRH
jgi:CheY-like chemotaxis protein